MDSLCCFLGGASGLKGVVISSLFPLPEASGLKGAAKKLRKIITNTLFKATDFFPLESLLLFPPPEASGLKGAVKEIEKKYDQNISKN